MARSVAHYNLQHVGEPRQNDLETGTLALARLVSFHFIFFVSTLHPEQIQMQSLKHSQISNFKSLRTLSKHLKGQLRPPVCNEKWNEK